MRSPRNPVRFSSCRRSSTTTACCTWPTAAGSSPASMRRRVSECGGNDSEAPTVPHLWRPTVASTSSVKPARRSCSRVGVAQSSWPETTSRPAFLRLRRSPTARSSSAPTAISSPSEAKEESSRLPAPEVATQPRSIAPGVVRHSVVSAPGVKASRPLFTLMPGWRTILRSRWRCFGRART